MEDLQPSTEVKSLPAPGTAPAGQSDRGRIIGIAVAVLVVVALLITGVVFLLRQPPEQTGQVRDVFIIFMALEALVIGAALVILIVQLSVLINLLQNEIQPIVKATNETVNTLRGTVTFMSDNLSEPIIKLNEYLAALKRLVDILRPGRH